MKAPNREVNLEYITGFNKSFGKINVNAFFGGNQMRKNLELFVLSGSVVPMFPFHAAINNAISQTFDYYYEGVVINSLFASTEIAYNNYLFITGNRS